MKKEDQIKQAADNYIVENILYPFSEIMDEILNDNSIYLEKFVLQIDQYLDKILQMQIKEKKDSINYIVFSFLYSGIDLGTFEIQLEAFDEKFYLDESPITGKVKSYILEKYWNTDWNDFYIFMQKKIIRLQYSDIYPYRKLFITKYNKLIRTFLLQFIPIIIFLEKFQKIKKSDDFRILYGEYRSKCEVLYEVDKDEILYDQT